MTIACTLYEETSLQRSRVDAENRIIRDVLVCGLKSKNDRSYPRDVLERALPLYSDRPVRMGVSGRDGIAEHRAMVPDFSGDAFSDRVGALKNVRIAHDGVRAEILVREGAMGDHLLWIAENSPRQVGLSHEAHGDIDHNGRVREIDTVAAVAVVDFPGTTRGLFESERRVIVSQEYRFKWEAIQLEARLTESVSANRPQCDRGNLVFRPVKGN